MELDIIFKVGAIGIIIAIITQILSQTKKDEMATLVTLLGVIIVMTIVMNMLGQLFNEVKAIFNVY